MVRALIVEGAFVGYRALAREKLAGFWPTWLLQWPLSLTIDDRYRPIERIAELAPLPILIIQGEADRVVPPHHGMALFEAAGEPKQLWLLPGTGHIQAFGRIENRRRLREYLTGISPARGLRLSRSAAARLGRRAPAAPRRGRRHPTPAGAAADRRRRSPAARARP